MKIAEIIANFPPHHGGMGYVCYHNALELSRRGHDVTVFTLDYKESCDMDHSVAFRIVRLRSPLKYGDGGMVPQLFSRLKGFDIIHLHYPFYGGAEYVYFAKLLRGSRYFLTYHMDASGNNLLKNLLIRLYSKVFLKSIIRNAGLIGALNRAHLKSSHAARFVDWKKVVDIPNGVDADMFSPADKDRSLLEKYGLTNKIVVLFVGNLMPLKGVHILIDAMSMIKNDKIVLLIVGGGYSEAEYKKRVSEIKLGHKVIFAGPQSPAEDLPLYYNLCDFLVLPSTSESFGLVILEAMASGKPVIVSSLPGPSQLVDVGKDGLLFKTGDREDLKNKIEFLAGNAEIRNNMGIAARNKVLRNYSWEIIGAKLEKTLLSLAKE